MLFKSVVWFEDLSVLYDISQNLFVNGKQSYQQSKPLRLLNLIKIYKAFFILEILNCRFAV